MSARVDDLPVGGRVWFAEEKKPYTVQARSRRYLVCNKPFAARKTVLYCIVDLKARVRGPENMVFGLGAETREQCEAMLRRLEDADDPSEVSRRRDLPLSVARVEHPSVPSSVVLAVDPSRSSPQAVDFVEATPEPPALG